MVVPIYKETKHKKVKNVDGQGYSEHENTKMKAQCGSSMLEQWKKPLVQSERGQVVKTTMHLKQTLRVESLSVGTDRDCHVWCKF